MIRELAALGFASMIDYAEWSGHTLTFRPSAEIDGRAVKRIKQTTKVIGNTEDGPILSFEQSIELHDKLGALVKTGEHLGMFERRVALGNLNDKPLQVSEADGLSVEERAARILALLERARARRALGAADPDAAGLRDALVHAGEGR